MISSLLDKRWVAASCGVVAVFLSGSALAQIPTIVEQPRALSVGPGDRAGFVVTASGAAPLSYQWYRGGTLIAGATGDFLLLPSAQTSDAGDYTVRISNAQGAVTSVAAKLAVAAYTREWVDPTYHGVGEPLLILPDGGTLSMISAANGLVRTMADGKLDSGFVFTAPTAGPMSYWKALAAARRDDGRFYVISSTTGVTHGGDYIAFFLKRLNSDGSVDSSFTSPLDETGHYVTNPKDVKAGLAKRILLPVGEKVIVAKDGTLVRLNRDGSLDPTFQLVVPTTVPTTFVVTAASLDRAGNILVGGAGYLWKAKSDGSQETGFSVAGNLGNVTEIALTPDGGCWVASIAPDDSIYANLSRYQVSRLTSLGQPDPAVKDFSLGTFDSEPPSMSLQADGRVVIAGFGDVRRTLGEEERTEIHRGVLRLLVDGSVDPSFFPSKSDSLSWSKWWMLPDGAHALSGELRVNLSTLGPIEPPRILRIEQSAENLSAGDDLTIHCIAVGPTPMAIWINQPSRKLSGDRFVVSNLQSRDVTVTVIGPAGETMRRVNFDLAPSAPRFTEPLTPVVAREGQWALLNATVRGSNWITYQWLKDGVVLNDLSEDYGQGRIALSLGNAAAASASTYTLRATNSWGTAECSTTLTVTPTSQLSNLSVRATAGTGDNVMIVGFVLQNQKKLLFQAIGPELANYGVTGVLGDPTATLHAADGTDISNDNGGIFVLGQIDPLYQATGAWILDGITTKSAELGLERIDGVNTIVVAGKDGTSGVALAQIFDADGSTNRMINLSARVFAGVGDATAITGFTIKGDAPRKVLIRCVGPGLTGTGVGNVLLDPKLTLVDQKTHETILTNDNWGTGASADVSELRTTMQSVGAFPLVEGSKDAALLVTLPPGQYTALVSGANGATGIVLLEVYDVP
jgi:hypothetical protein